MSILNRSLVLAFVTLLGVELAHGEPLHVAAAQQPADLAVGTSNTWRFHRPTPSVRGADAAGCGGFYCGRGHRMHAATDYLVVPGELIVAPIDGEVARIGFAYPGDRDLRLIVIRANHGLVARMLYVNPIVAAGSRVTAGQPLGYAQDVREHYPDATGLPPHVHLDITINGKRIDPENDPQLLR